MQNNDYIENLCAFGLTRQEACIYSELLVHGKMTGYELSKETGISRSNVYVCLNALTDKGAAYIVEEESTKYIPVSVNQFTKNYISQVKTKAEYLLKNAPKKVLNTDGYITITGNTNIRNKIRQMINETKLRLYILAPSVIIRDFETELNQLIRRNVKVVLMTEGYKLKGARLYETKPEEGQIRFITDSSYVLTGEITGSEHDTCLYSGQSHLVEVMKEALKNKIILLENKK